MLDLHMPNINNMNLLISPLLAGLDIIFFPCSKPKINVGNFRADVNMKYHNKNELSINY